MTKKFLHFCFAVACIVAATKLPGQDATALLQRAHEARASWRGFPGFRAQVHIADEQVAVNGWVQVDAQGNIQCQVPDAPSWFEPKLKSFVEHRFGDDRDYQATFQPDSPTHPLGQLVKIENDALMGSRYRVKDDVVREVHRTMPDSRFTITVLEVKRNPQRKYLPGVYTVSYWDAQGKLTSVTVEVDDWLHRDGWDLPLRWLTVRSADGGARQVRSVQFSDHTWLTNPAANGRP